MWAVGPERSPDAVPQPVRDLVYEMNLIALKNEVAGSGDLRSLTNVILTPHVGSNTAEANGRMAERALQNIMLARARAFARMDLLNPEVLSSTDVHPQDQTGAREDGRKNP